MSSKLGRSKLRGPGAAPARGHVSGGQVCRDQDASEEKKEMYLLLSRAECSGYLGKKASIVHGSSEIRGLRLWRKCPSPLWRIKHPLSASSRRCPGASSTRGTPPSAQERSGSV